MLCHALLMFVVQLFAAAHGIAISLSELPSLSEITQQQIEVLRTQTNIAALMNHAAPFYNDMSATSLFFALRNARNVGANVIEMLLRLDATLTDKQQQQLIDLLSQLPERLRHYLGPTIDWDVAMQHQKQTRQQPVQEQLQQPARGEL